MIVQRLPYHQIRVGRPNVLILRFFRTEESLPQGLSLPDAAECPESRRKSPRFTR
jgi:hypothetical protein